MGPERRAALTAAVPTDTATLIQVIDTSGFDPPSPDPAGVVYLPSRGHLMVADSEVDETTGAGYHGVNLWEIALTGDIRNTGTTLPSTNEPTGLGYDPGTDTLFVSTDVKNRIWLFRPGPDGRFGSSDDVLDFFGTGVSDTEDPEFDMSTGHLFFVDGAATEVYRIDPVNGVFGDGDDAVSHFDVGRYGARDTEALGSADGKLLVGDRASRQIYEVTKDGALVRIIDASGIPGMRRISGLGVGPASYDASERSIYIVDRAVDNGRDPNENDGKLFEITYPGSGSGPGNAPPSVNAGPDQQVTLPDPLTLNGSATDDGLPDPPGALTTSWSQVSGPGTVAFGDAASPSTTASFPQTGTYVLQLTADDSELQSTDELTVTVVDAGSTPTNLVGNPGFEVDTSGWNVAGSGSGVTLSRVPGGHSGGWAGQLSNGGSSNARCKLNDHPNWVDVTTSGTYGASMWVRADTPGATLTMRIREYAGSLAGKQTAKIDLTTSWQLVSLDHVIRSPGSTLDLQVWTQSAPGVCFTADDVTISPPGAPPPAVNAAPSVNAGPDQQVTFPDLATLNGSATDDGQPDPPGTLTTTWSQVSGPGTVAFSDAASPSTTASFPQTGTYVLRLTADDSELQAADELTVTVVDASGGNQAPAVDAGPDQQVTFPDLATLNGSATDDGQPDPPGALTTTWSQVSGPGTVAFGDAGSPSTTASFPQTGAYVLRLTADDSELQAADELTVTVVDGGSPNLVGNPGFEPDTSGWNVSGSGSGVTLSRVPGGHSGGWSGQLSNGGSAGVRCKLNDKPNWVDVTTAGTYAASMWVRADTPGATLTMRIREYAGSLAGKQMVDIQLTTSWQLVTLDYVIRSPGSTLDLQAWIDNAPQGVCFFVDDVAIQHSS